MTLLKGRGDIVFSDQLAGQVCIFMLYKFGRLEGLLLDSPEHKGEC